MANGVFEHIPFRDEEFDAVLCGYSLRDAINLTNCNFRNPQSPEKRMEGL